jgi:hypothetical protein
MRLRGLLAATAAFVMTTVALPVAAHDAADAQSSN